MARVVDPLFVALTRPPMKWGVPFEGFKWNVILTAGLTIFIIQAPPGFFLGLIVHFVLREVARVDPHFFHKWKLWSMTRARSITKHLWGGSRLQPSSGFVSHASQLPSCL